MSIATVSRVINGSDRVSPRTRQKVLRVIEENGYTPNAFARGLGLNTMHTIGLLCADAADPYLAQAVNDLERRLRQSGSLSAMSELPASIELRAYDCWEKTRFETHTFDLHS